MKELAERLKALGINAGGKAEVVGSVFEADEEKLKKALSEVLDVLRSMGYEADMLPVG